jgi:4-hydroxy-3-methylbut-2-enyl diphosphate reductase
MGDAYKESMKIIMAKEVGFCKGVQEAVKKVFFLLKENAPVYTLGPIIHNPQMVERLSAMGAKVIKDDKLPRDGYILVRSHGVPKSLMEKALRCGANVVDTTCVNVKKVQQVAEEQRKLGKEAIFVGKLHHPETESVKEILPTLHIVESVEDLEALPNMKEASLFCQTTVSFFLFEEVREKLKEKVERLSVFDTLCVANKRRQKEASLIAKRADIVFVVGGRNSANTNTLYNICANSNSSTYHIETEEQIKEWMLEGVETVGLLTGTSTPSWVLEEVVEKIKRIKI